MKKILAVLGVLTMVGCTKLGTRPDVEDKKRFESSKQFNKDLGIFQNVRPERMKAAEERVGFWELLFKFLKGVENDSPKEKLVEVRPDLEEFLKPTRELKSIWFGHSTFLLNVEGKIVLVDPVFSKSASPISFMVKRFQDPVLKLEELPEIDYILISHDHYDHLDRDSVKFFKSANAKFITPLGVGGHLEGWGISRERIIERDWWESVEFDGLSFTATPSQHFSGRSFSDKNETLWASWVIKGEDHNIYFSGDSGYDSHFKEIGDRFGPFDVAYIESGQYNKMWPEVHLHPEEGVEAFKDLNAKRYFPVHWGMFVLSMHTWSDPIERLYKLSKKENFDLVAPKLGQIVNFDDPDLSRSMEAWWENQ